VVFTPSTFGCRTSPLTQQKRRCSDGGAGRPQVWLKVRRKRVSERGSVKHRSLHCRFHLGRWNHVLVCHLPELPYEYAQSLFRGDKEATPRLSDLSSRIKQTGAGSMDHLRQLQTNPVETPCRSHFEVIGRGPPEWKSRTYKRLRTRAFTAMNLSESPVVCGAEG